MSLESLLQNCNVSRLIHLDDVRFLCSLLRALPFFYIVIYSGLFCSVKINSMVFIIYSYIIIKCD